jgi:hypothetical protein
MLGSLFGGRFRPLRIAAVLVPSATAFYVLACGDASNTDAQNYFADSPILGTSTTVNDAGVVTVVLADGAVVTPIPDVYVAPVYFNDTGTHGGTVALSAATATSASVDLYSSVAIPLTLTSQEGFSGTASILSENVPGNIGIAFSPDDPAVTPDTPGTCIMTVTTKGGQAPGTLNFKVLAFGGGASIDAGAPLAISVTVNPQLTITIPTAFEANTGMNLPNYQLGAGSSLATSPIHVIFQNQDSTDWFEVGANGAQAGFPNGQKAIAPNGGTEPDFSGNYTDAGTKRVIDQKGTYAYYALGYGSTEAIAESGGGTDAGQIQPYKGQIQVQ